MVKILNFTILNCLLIPSIYTQNGQCSDTVAKFSYSNSVPETEFTSINSKIYKKTHKLVKDKINPDLKTIHLKELDKYHTGGIRLYLLQDSLHYLLGYKNLFIMNSKFHILHILELNTILNKNENGGSIFDMFVLDGNIYLQHYDYIFRLTSDLKQIKKLSIDTIATYLPGIKRDFLAKIAICGKEIDYFYFYQGISTVEINSNKKISQPIIIIDTGFNLIYAKKIEVNLGTWYDNRNTIKKNHVSVPNDFNLLEGGFFSTWFYYKDSAKIWLRYCNEFLGDSIIDSEVMGEYSRYIKHKDQETLIPITWEFTVSLKEDLNFTFKDIEINKGLRKLKFGFRNTIFKQNHIQMNAIRNEKMTSFEILSSIDVQNEGKVNLYGYESQKERLAISQKQYNSISNFNMPQCISTSLCEYVNNYLRCSSGSRKSDVEFYPFKMFSYFHHCTITKVISEYQKGNGGFGISFQQYSNDGTSYLFNSKDNMMILIDSNGFMPYNDYELKLWQPDGKPYSLSMFLESKGLPFIVPIYFYDNKAHDSKKYKEWEEKIFIGMSDSSKKNIKLIGGWLKKDEDETKQKVGGGGFIKDSIYNFKIVPGKYTLVVDAILIYPDVGTIRPLVLFDYDTGYGKIDTYGRRIYNNKYYQMDIKRTYLIKVRKSGKILVRQIE